MNGATNALSCGVDMQTNMTIQVLSVINYQGRPVLKAACKNQQHPHLPRRETISEGTLWSTVGAEPDSASEGVDTVVGEASQVAKTGSTIKTQKRPDDPKVGLQTCLWCTADFQTL